MKPLVEIQLPHYTMLELLHAVTKHSCEPTNSPNLSSKQVKSDCKHIELVSVQPPVLLYVCVSVLMCFDFWGF